MFFLVLPILLFLITSIYALSLSPSKKNFNFEPGLEETISFTVRPDTSREIVMYVEGDLAEYITLDKDKLSGDGGKFTATLKLPEKLDRPGEYRTLVMVSEYVDPELAGFIVVAVKVGSVIRVHVPFPGQYLETKLEVKDANVGDPIDFNLEVKSKGKENVSISPIIEIYDSNGKNVDTLLYNSRVIKSQEILNLRKTLDTTGYNPGGYKAVSTIYYGAIAKSETDFRVGDLNVRILNYTDVVPINKFEKFDIIIESGWNNNIAGVYGEVVIYNESKEITRFQTFTTSLTPWEQQTITGYFDTSNFTEGKYDANITTYFFGKSEGRSTSVFVPVRFVKAKSLFLWYILGGAGIFIILGLLIFRIFSKNGKKRKKKGRK